MRIRVDLPDPVLGAIEDYRRGLGDKLGMAISRQRLILHLLKKSLDTEFEARVEVENEQSYI